MSLDQARLIQQHYEENKRLRAAVVQAAATIDQLMQEVASREDHPVGLMAAAELTRRQCSDVLTHEQKLDDEK